MQNKKTYVTLSHTLVSNHAPKKQTVYDQKKNIRTLRSKNKDYPDTHIVDQTITMTDKVFLRSTWLEV